MADSIRAALEAFLAAHPKTERIDLLFPDINGVIRGKWLPVGSADKLADGGVRLPVSTSALDIWGVDVEGTGLGIVSGDSDGIGQPVMSSLAPVPWSARPSAQVLMELDAPEGGPSIFDPRHRLAAVLEEFSARGLRPVVATELEFYLIDARKAEDAPPVPPQGTEGSHLYDLEPMATYEDVLHSIQDAAADQNLPVDVVIAEAGQGQYEINFLHTDEALLAADHAVLFKRMVRGVARDNGLNATFMAKPYGEDMGSGMHVHVSVLNSDGENIFDAGEGEEASDTLRHAIGGVLENMADLQAICAPNVNSYRRFQPGSFAPTQINWGYDHRAVSVRVPEVAGNGARLEHRICGADSNPYLVLAAILGSVLDGLEKKTEPGPNLEADESANRGDLSWDWRTAVERFAASSIGPRVFGEEFARVYTELRRWEIQKLNTMVTDVEFRTYLGRI